MNILNSKIKIFIFFALTTLVLGLMVQFILPLIIPNSFTDGLFNYLKDSLRFHHLAVAQAKMVEVSGWSSFSWKPENQLPGGILTVFYVLSGIKLPFWYLILNSLLLGWSAVLVHEYLIECKLNQKWRILVSLGLLFTPTSLTWITQVSKDIFVVFGLVSVGYSLLCLHKKRSILFLIFLFIGSWTIFLFKDYMIEIILLGVLCFILLQLLSKTKRTLSFISASVLGLSFLFSETYLSARYYANPSDQISELQNTTASSVIPTPSAEVPQVAKEPKETYSYDREFPVLDTFLERLSVSNYKFLTDFPKGKENFHSDNYITSTTEALIHIPLALGFGFFEPYPFRSRWNEGGGKGLMFTILQLEMLLAYLAYGIILKYFILLSKEDKMYVLGNVIICLGFLLVFGFSVPNLGTMNRYRFPFLLIMKLVAFYVWANKNNRLTEANQ